MKRDFFEIHEVSVLDMANAREMRLSMQKMLLEKHKKPVLSFMLNIPGAVKSKPIFSEAFNEGIRRMLDVCRKNDIGIEETAVKKIFTGNEFYAVLNSNAKKIKTALVNAEESDALGRLFDADVIDTDGKKIAREEIGLECRKCLLCGCPAHECSRSRKHTVLELTGKIESIICDWQRNKIEKISRFAMLSEVYATPKPGLVDRADNGAHTDMDIPLFEKSAQAVAPFIAQMYQTAFFWTDTLDMLFAKIREIGRSAENAMFSATNGVNTHKGMIFTMGLLASGAGFSAGHFLDWNAETAIDTAKEMAQNALEADFAAMKKRPPKTHGEILFSKYGERGIRGQALDGFPILKNIALPFLRELKKAAFDENERNVMLLLKIIAHLDDTNVLSRSSRESLEWLQGEAQAILGKNERIDMNAVSELNRACIAKNISPGGAADILAVALFLEKITE